MSGRSKNERPTSRDPVGIADCILKILYHPRFPKSKESQAFAEIIGVVMWAAANGKLEAMSCHCGKFMDEMAKQESA